MIGRIKTFYYHKPWTGRFIITFVVLSLLVIGARIALSPGLIYGATSWLKKQGIESTIEAVDINIFDGTVTLRNARGNKNGKHLFKIGLVDIHWQWEPLSNKTIEVTRVAIDSLSVNIRQYADTIIVGGVSIPLGQTEARSDETSDEADTNETDENVKTWAASLGEVTFTNLNICYSQNTSALAQSSNTSNFIDYCIDLDEMSWAGTISYATDAELLKTDDIPVSSTGNFSLDGLSVTDNRLNKNLLTSKSNTLNNVTIRGLNKLHIDQLKMNDLSLFQREHDQHSDSLRFHQLTVSDIKLSNLNSVSISDIKISKPGTYLVRQNQTDWEYQQWIPRPSADDETTKKTQDKKQVGKASTFKFTLNNLDINNSDLCYLDISTSLYYCLTFEELVWKGKVKYDTESSRDGTVNLLAKGDLELSHPNIHNQTIDRDLLDLKMLALTRLEVTDTNSISIEKLILDKLIALQRSKDKSDTTVSFDTLAIDKIKYTNNKITINTIDLKGLAGTISKNKNGDWEYDKWLVDNKSGTSEKTENTQHKTTPAEDNEPLAVGLNKLSIVSDNKITFTDNSTQPAMKAGLNNISFDISNVYTDKPDANSTFKLYAKTTRHSTINIEGTVKPFADKISFDANGKLKGFDLRAASPATKKAIGHIIQSGQMDADLKLLAIDGELDSNIALSLYHFRIKSVSKADTKKLDERFGLPLNQTLVLLRDKDDSIHLDIPITGDVNNPNFEPMDAIIKATSKAATVTLITFYTPYGLIYAGGNLAFNLATALNFDPVKFTPGSSEINTAGKEQLNGLTRLLTEKPQVHLTLCGVTNRQDTFALYPEIKENYYDKNKDDENIHSDITLTKKQSLQLEQLARDRQVNTKNYLVNQSDIEHDRLILCAPEHKTGDDAIAGVEIII